MLRRLGGAPRLRGSYPVTMHETAGLRLSRAVAVLAVIAGVLAMHGLASTHHGATAAPLIPALLAPANVEGHAHHAAAPADAAAPGQAVASAAHDCGLLCPSGEHGLALLCVAVLLAAAAGVLVLRQRTGALPMRTGPAPILRVRSTAPPRSFDLVAELCVSRT